MPDVPRQQSRSHAALPRPPTREYDRAMATGRDDLFPADGAQPATPGSYGQPPSGTPLPAGTRVGPVRLQVASLARSLAYYTDVLGLAVRERGDDRAALGPHDDARVLVHLEERAGAARADARPHTGLYHFAILVPDRTTLGAFVRHLSQLGVRAGAGDHLVSEAFYLTDPDGLGIEVYADRPREAWRRQGRELMMATDPVNVHDLLRAAGDAAWEGMPAGTVMGHVHLHVGDTSRAAAFYGDGLGFDRMVWSYPGALFFGADGYHHHVGTNTWAGPRATAPAADDAQLLAWTLELPDEAALSSVASQVAAAGAAITRTDEGFETRDPWGTAVAVRAVPA